MPTPARGGGKREGWEARIAKFSVPTAEIPSVSWSGALTFGYGCTVHVGVDVGAGDVEVDLIYISFIMSVQYIWTTGQPCTVLYMII